MKNKNLFESIRAAICGIRLAYREERNLTTYLMIALLFFIINILLKSTRMDFIILFLLCALVIGTELINTAIERIVDQLVSEKNEHAKFIKDVAAGAVLIFGMAFFVIEGLILLK